MPGLGTQIALADDTPRVVVLDLWRPWQSPGLRATRVSAHTVFLGSESIIAAKGDRNPLGPPNRSRFLDGSAFVVAAHVHVAVPA